MNMIERLEVVEVGVSYRRVYVCEGDRHHTVGTSLFLSRSQALNIDGRYRNGVYVGPDPRLACSSCRDQPSLFDDGQPALDAERSTGTHRTGDHHTSAQAGLRDLGGRGRNRARLAVAHLRYPDGLTDEEAARIVGIAPQSSPWKRCTDLREWGYLTYAGFDRPTSTGSHAKVWTLTAAGRAAVEQHFNNEGENDGQR